MHEIKIIFKKKMFEKSKKPRTRQDSNQRPSDYEINFVLTHAQLIPNSIRLKYGARAMHRGGTNKVSIVT